MIELSTWVLLLVVIVAVLLLAGVLWLTLRLMKLSAAHVTLTEETTQLRQIMQHMPAPVWLHTETEGIMYVNPCYERALGAPADEVIKGQQWLTNHVPAYEMPEGVKFRHHYEHCIIDGQRKWLQVHDIKTDEGWMSIGLDFTSLEAKQRELDEFNDFANDLIASSTNAIAIFDSNRQLQRYNHAYAVMWQLPQHFLNNAPTLNEILERQRESRALPEQVNFREFRQSINSLFESVIDLHEEFYYLPDNRTIKLVVIPHAMGGLLFSYEDLTEKIALEQSYNTLSSINRMTVDALEEAIVVLGENGRVQLTNPAYRDLWGLPQDYLETHPHINDMMEHAKESVLLPGEDWEQRKQAVLQLVARREVSQQRIPLPNGNVYSRTTHPLPDGAFMMSYLDISDSYRVEESLRAEKEALQRADAIRTKFLDNVSYELRSPLTSIKGFAELLLQGYLGDLNERQTEYLRDMVAASQRLNKIIDNVIDATNIDAGFMVLNREQFAVQAVIEEALQAVQKEAEEKALKVVCDIDDAVEHMLADRARILQVLVNLLHNAIKHENNEGTVTVLARKESDTTLLLQVKDTGRGMTLESQQGLFDKFQATHSDGVMTGFGLSLSLAKSFVELHEGTMEIESRENVGTIISCRFPQAEDDTKQAE